MQINIQLDEGAARALCQALAQGTVRPRFYNPADLEAIRTVYDDIRKALAKKPHAVSVERVATTTTTVTTTTITS